MWWLSQPTVPEGLLENFCPVTDRCQHGSIEHFNINSCELETFWIFSWSKSKTPVPKIGFKCPSLGSYFGTNLNALTSGDIHWKTDDEKCDLSSTCCLLMPCTKRHFGLEASRPYPCHSVFNSPSQYVPVMSHAHPPEEHRIIKCPGYAKGWGVGVFLSLTHQALRLLAKVCDAILQGFSSVVMYIAGKFWMLILTQHPS